MEFTIDLKNFIYVVSIFGAWLTSYITNKIQTKENTTKIIKISQNYEDLKDKCNLMMEEKKARETFVSMELYKSEVNHLNKSMDEIKIQNNKILDLLQESK